MAIIALAVNILRRCKNRSVTVAVGREPIPFQLGAVDVVLATLADVCLRRRQVEVVAATAEIIDIVVFEIEFGMVAGAQVAAEPHHPGLQ